MKGWEMVLFVTDWQRAVGICVSALLKRHEFVPGDFVQDLHHPLIEGVLAQLFA